MTARRDRPRIDREKMRSHARTLDGAGLLVWLDRAIDLLPDEALAELVADYVALVDVVDDGMPSPDLLQAIRRFHAESLAGRYYEAFPVTSHSYLEHSRGTQIFIAEHTRLVDACLKAERSGDLATAGEGLGLLIDLMRHIDRCEVDIVFFADEAGSWQVGVNWARVLPAWFRCLVAVLAPHEWADAVLDAIDDFAGHQGDTILAVARDIATPEQRAALEKLERDSRGGVR